MLMRKCTSEFKVTPIERQIRLDSGHKKGERIPKRSVNLWLGISRDEVFRVKNNMTPWIQNVYPLIEIGWNRQDCLDYCTERLKRTVAKSRCFMCPYVRDWQEMKRHQPHDFARAVAFDLSIRNSTKKGVKAPVYLHRSCLPLSEFVVDQGHLWEGFDDDFVNECTGSCGL
jgi:hypothetical protein